MSIFKQLLRYYLLMVAIFFIGRATLFILYFDNFSSSEVNYWLTFIYGLRMDTIVASILLAVPLILLSFAPAKFKYIVNIFLKYYFLIFLLLIIYIENATFPFFAQYDIRPNYLFVEYLVYPKEVFSMIFADYKLELLVATLVMIGFTYFYVKMFKNGFLKVFETAYIKRIAFFLPLALIIFIGIRSSFGHRPANVSDAMYSSHRLVNEITKNSLHNIAYAMYIRNKYNSKNLNQDYGDMELSEALERMKRRLNIQSEDKEFPLSRTVHSNFKTDNPKNLVIFVQESLGYQFVESVGGEKGITPHLNALSKDGILFTELYSNGTRSIRGLAGTTSGNFAVPGTGVIKRNKSQSDFFTLATALKPFGYYTSFIYGGEGRFDNMKAWYLGNGFDEVIDQPKFCDPTFTATWGVCDEDLVNQANAEFKRLHSQKKKFATVMFSQSNHAPFEYPENKITPIDGLPVNDVKNAVKYADYAIGKFIELAKKEEYYKDTVFVIVADHNVRVYGNDMVPVDMFKIPALILGKDIKAKKYEKLATQPDILATALDLIGLDLNYPIMGHSIFSDKKQNIALMQFHTSYALRVDDKVAIIRPNKKAMTFKYKNPKNYLDKNNHLTEIEHDYELEKDALAFVLSLDYIYNKKLYNTPKDTYAKSTKL